MSDTTEHLRLRIWRFHCPDCGFGDQEIGLLGLVDEIYCEVCLSGDEPRRVTLRRWQEELPIDEDKK